MSEESGWLVEEDAGGFIHWIALAENAWPRTELRDRRLGSRRTTMFERYLSPVTRVKDAGEALRFARKQDADAFITLFDRFLLNAIATEHCWPTTNPLSPDELVLKVARAICWAFSEETDDCSSVCLNAKRCMTDDVADSFKRDARAAIAAMPELTELQQRVKQLEEALRALFELWDNYQDSDLSQMHAHDRLVRWEVWSAARKALEARKSRSLLSDKGEVK